MQVHSLTLGRRFSFPALQFTVLRLQEAGNQHSSRQKKMLFVERATLGPSLFGRGESPSTDAAGGDIIQFTIE